MFLKLLAKGVNWEIMKSFGGSQFTEVASIAAVKPKLILE